MAQKRTDEKLNTNSPSIKDARIILKQGVLSVSKNKEKVLFRNNKGVFTIEREGEKSLWVSSSQAIQTYSFLMNNGYKKDK